MTDKFDLYEEAKKKLKLAKKARPEEAAKLIMDALMPFKVSARYGTFNLYDVNEAMAGAFTYIGEGCFSTAYAFNKDWVIKINAVCNCDSPRDTGFDYLKMATGLQHNQFVPKIASLEQHGKLYIAVVERLKPNPSGLTPSSSGLHDFGKAAASVKFNLQKYAAKDGVYTNVLRFIVMNPEEFTEAAREIYGVYRASGSRYDCHDENVMLRRDGSMVITDPLAEGRKISLGAKKTFSWSANV